MLGTTAQFCTVGRGIFWTTAAGWLWTGVEGAWDWFVEEGVGIGDGAGVGAGVIIWVYILNGSEDEDGVCTTFCLIGRILRLLFEFTKGLIFTEPIWVFEADELIKFKFWLDD